MKLVYEIKTFKHTHVLHDSTVRQLFGIHGVVRCLNGIIYLFKSTCFWYILFVYDPIFISDNDLSSFSRCRHGQLTTLLEDEYSYLLSLHSTIIKICKKKMRHEIRIGKNKRLYISHRVANFKLVPVFKRAWQNC